MLYREIGIYREPASVRDFRMMAEDGYRKANPSANSMVISWDDVRKVTFPTGLVGYIGEGMVTAEGYASKRIFASWTKHGLMVR